MASPSSKDYKSVHFIGIGGIGMSALARYYRSQGWTVSGSDVAASGILLELEKEGIKARLGHRAANVPKNCALVVYNSAIPPRNPEIAAAKEKAIALKSYAEAIGGLTRLYKTVAVSGSHGKSTTAALVSLALIKGKLDPTVIIGTKLKEFGGKNFRSGKSDLLVLESDEYKRAFHHYSPTLAIVNNIDKEHLDCYKNLREVQNSFLKFLGNTTGGGAWILNGDDPSLRALRPRIKEMALAKKISVYWYGLTMPEAKEIGRIIQIPGKHNISNALGAFILTTRRLGISPKIALEAISQYRGAWRRMEYKGKFKMQNAKCKVKVYDDYAHHPTEIKATLAGFREAFSKSGIICVFQPHQALRLQKLFSEFKNSFHDADALILLPTYEVAGRDNIKSAFTSERLAREIQKKFSRKRVIYLENPKNLRKVLLNLDLRFYIPNSIVIMMGAGSIFEYTELLINKRR